MREKEDKSKVSKSIGEKLLTLDDRTVRSNSIIQNNKSSTSLCTYIIRCFTCTKKVLTLTRRTTKISKLTQTNSNQSAKEKRWAVLREIISLKRMDEWDEYVKNVQGNMTNESIADKLISYFYEGSKLIVIWRSIFSVFVVCVVYIYFFKFVCLDLLDIIENSHNHFDESLIDKNVYKIYYLICLMYAIDFLISVIKLFTSKSLLMILLNIFIILPIKFAMCVPFSLSSSFFWLTFKFLRLDLIHTLFTIFKDYCYKIIENHIHNSILKVIMIYLNEIFKFFLIFVLYAHFMTCVFAYIEKENASLNQLHFSNQDFYITCLYSTFSTFTNVGYGDYVPGSNLAIFLFMVNMYFGFDLFCVVILHVKMLFLTLNNYKKQKTFAKNFDKFIFTLQKNTGRIIGKNLKNVIYSHNLIKRGLHFLEIFKSNENLFRNCRNDIKNHLTQCMFDYLYKEYAIFFKDCSSNFVVKIFSKLTPKIFKPGKVIINLNRNVDSLYFLLTGEICILNKDRLPMFEIKSSTIFGDWYFHTNTYSDYIYKVSNKTCAVCFVLNKEDYIKIAEEDVISAREFSIKSLYKMKIYKDMADIFSEDALRVSEIVNRTYSVDNLSYTHNNSNNTSYSSYSNAPFQPNNNKTNNSEISSNNISSSWDELLQSATNTSDLKEKMIEYQINMSKKKIYELEMDMITFRAKFTDKARNVSDRIFQISESFAKTRNRFSKSKEIFGKNLRDKINSFFVKENNK